MKKYINSLQVVNCSWLKWTQYVVSLLMMVALIGACSSRATESPLPTTQVIINLTSTSTDDFTGAVVTLENEVYKYEKTAEGNTVVFDEIVFGTYTIVIVFPDFIDFSASLIVDSEAGSEPIIREIVLIPIYSTITFDGNGGGTPPEPITVETGVPITLPPAGSLFIENYEFVGWNTLSSGMGVTYEVDSTYITDGDATLYAKWDALNGLTVNFDGNGHTSGTVPSSIVVTEAREIILPPPNLEKTGYKVYGWNTKPDGEGESYNAGARYRVVQEVTFYALWIDEQLDIVTVYWDDNGATESYPPYGAMWTQPRDTEITIPDVNYFYREGYEPICWNTAANGTGDDYSEGDTYIVTADITFYVKWDAIYVTATFVCNAPDTIGDPPDPITEIQGKTITIPDSGTLERAGYNFNQWVYRNPFGVNEFYRPGEEFELKADVTFTAVWAVDL